MAKINLTIQAAGVEVTEASVKEAVKAAWVADGRKVKEIDTLDIYVKPEEKKAYYVVNESENGSVDL
ncbi:MAG: hypothetical protein IKN24_00095 [Lachnospiraceae bacterium]|nr:hypothetical protein [Lachnospiraceae bacterium]